MIRLSVIPNNQARPLVISNHYSRAYPACNVRNYLVEENGQPIGCIVFNVGNICIHRPFKVEPGEAIQLARVALGEHTAPTSQIVATAIRLFHKEFPRVRVLVSYADGGQQHWGTIYQAMNWQFVGAVKSRHYLIVDGKLMHTRQAGSLFGSSGVKRITELGHKVEQSKSPGLKFKYVYLFDKSIQIIPLQYPKCAGGVIGNTPDPQLGAEGSRPIPALPLALS